MKHKLRSIIAAGLMALMLAVPFQTALAFCDVSENASYAEAVEYLNNIGVMQGDTNGNFNPDKPVSRAEMAAIVCRVLGETENLTTSSTFTDVPASHWANGYVTKAASLGIIGGYGNGNFGPTDNVTYEQAVTMIVRATVGEDDAINRGGYPDGFIAVAEESNLLDTIIVQKGKPLSRAGVATILYNHYRNWIF